MTTTIQLTPQDTLPSLLARLQSAAGDRVLFVLPPGLSLSAVDLRALRREGAASERGVALVTSDAGLRATADRMGISTFRSQARGEHARWRRLRPEQPRLALPVGPAQAAPPSRPGLFARRSPSGSRPPAFLRSFVRRSSPWWTNLLLSLCLLLLLGGMILALAAVVPAAEVTLVPAAEPIRVTVALKAVQDSGLDTQAGILPATAMRVQVAGEATLPTTGRRYEPSAKAAGKVVIINRTARLLTVPSGTILSTATGDNVRFSVTEQQQVEPNGRTILSVEAVLPGPTSNVRAGTITQVEGPLALSAVVTNDAPTGGGGSAEVGVVTEEDQARLQSQLFEDLKQKALEQLREKLAPGTFLAPESVSYLAMSPTFTPFVGDVSPDLFLSMSVQAEGLSVDARSGDQLVLSRLQATMPPGSRLISDTVHFIPGAIVVEDPRTVSFSMTAEGTLLHGLDTREVRSTVLGMLPEQAVAALAQRFALAESPQVHLGPDWLPLIVPTKMPILPWRIRVQVDWDAAAEIARG
jgi:Baseplate J-like protein